MWLAYIIPDFEQWHFQLANSKQLQQHSPVELLLWGKHQWDSEFSTNDEHFA
ncbi:hypothetical protein LguiA_007337 [Lonicera macranthoides]